MSEWQDISTAPKGFVSRADGHRYGPYILGYPVFGEVARVRYWQSVRDPESCNYLEDGGNAVRPTHWMPLPEPPK